jgi:hypothetical protein
MDSIGNHYKGHDCRKQVSLCALLDTSAYVCNLFVNQYYEYQLSVLILMGHESIKMSSNEELTRSRYKSM